MFIRSLASNIYDLIIKMYLAFAFGILMSVTLVVWILCIFVYIFHDSAGVWEPFSPVRCVLAVILPLVIVRWGLKRKSLCQSGAYAAFVVGLVMTMSGYGFMAAMLAFFFAGSKVTKWRSDRKKKLEVDFKEGGQRDWMQVLCNGGVAAQLCLVHLINTGCAERLINFQQNYTSSWLAVGIVTSLACSCGDTFASEIGTVVGNWSPRLITTMQRVPKGTNGAISLVGTLASALGGLYIGLVYFVVMAICCRDDVSAPPQWPIIAITTFSGVYGSTVDSLLGATVQYTGVNVETGCIVQVPADNVKRISGVPLLDNHGVNLISSAVVAFTAPYVAFFVWGYYI